MKTFTDITLECDIEELERFCHLNRLRESFEEFEDVIEEGYRLIEPKAAYKKMKISKVNENSVIIEDEWAFTSELLADKFKCASVLAVYVVTIGPALEKRVTELGPQALSKSFILDCIGTYTLHQVSEIIQRDFQPEGGERISKFSPGSTSSWNIEQQRVLFDILGSEKIENEIGVRLNEFNIMIPRKSVSGVMGDIGEYFLECQICQKRCEYRRAPFKG